MCENHSQSTAQSEVLCLVTVATAIHHLAQAAQAAQVVQMVQVIQVVQVVQGVQADLMDLEVSAAAHHRIGPTRPVPQPFSRPVPHQCGHLLPRPLQLLWLSPLLPRDRTAGVHLATPSQAP